MGQKEDRVQLKWNDCCRGTVAGAWMPWNSAEDWNQTLLLTRSLILVTPPAPSESMSRLNVYLVCHRLAIVKHYSRRMTYILHYNPK